MEIGEQAAVGAGAVLVGWLGSVFFHGRKVGSMEQQFKALVELVAEHDREMKKNKVDHDADIQKLRISVEADLARLRLHHEEDIKRFQEFFTNSSGGQKFVTFPDHDLICEKNNKATIQAISLLTEALKENSEVVERMGDRIHILDKDVAVLKERRKIGLRQANGEDE